MYPEINREVIEKSKQGEVRAQYDLYRKYAKAMYNISYRIMGSVEEAEDMLQDAFAEAFRKISSYKYESAFGAWLKRIVINRCINEVKRSKINLDFFDDMIVFDSDENNDEEVQGLSVEAVRNAMEQLPRGNKIIFSLYLLEGYDHKEIAQILNTSESNSKSQYMRAKRRVKEILSSANHG
ncbi:MAG: sigma-70 family RNA polymerase sigma factor [Bacteroidales bacterium]|nr:sigma-70 family RNA polymerase sigma factor [Bacteroidales bacterium]